MKPDKKEKRLAKDLDKIDKAEESVPWKDTSSHDLQKVEVTTKVIIPRNKFSLEEAHAWCEKNGYKHNEVVKTDRHYYFYQ
jgi:hypothetical protein